MVRRSCCLELKCHYLNARIDREIAVIDAWFWNTLAMVEKIPPLLHLNFGVEVEEIQRWTTAIIWVFTWWWPNCPVRSTQTSQGLRRYFEKLRCKKIQFPMFADCSAGFDLVSPQPAHDPRDGPEDVPWMSRGMAVKWEGTLPLLCPISHLLSAGLVFGRCQKCYWPWLV